jgi:hypothetical protein
LIHHASVDLEMLVRKSFFSRAKAFKGVVVLPVREIGDVIFADFFRQIFAGVRVQALPFFKREIIYRS